MNVVENAQLQYYTHIHTLNGTKIRTRGTYDTFVVYRVPVRSGLQKNRPDNFVVRTGAMVRYTVRIRPYSSARQYIHRSTAVDLPLHTYGTRYRFLRLYVV